MVFHSSGFSCFLCLASAQAAVSSSETDGRLSLSLTVFMSDFSVIAAERGLLDDLAVIKKQLLKGCFVG